MLSAGAFPQDKPCGGSHWVSGRARFRYTPLNHILKATLRPAALALLPEVTGSSGAPPCEKLVYHGERKLYFLSFEFYFLRPGETSTSMQSSVLLFWEAAMTQKTVPSKQSMPTASPSAGGEANQGVRNPRLAYLVFKRSLRQSPQSKG